MSTNVSIVPGLYSDLNAAVKASEWEKVLTISNKVLSESPDEQKAFQCKTAALIHLGKFEDCLHHLKPSRSKFGVEQKFERAYCEYRLNRLAEALTSLENCDSPRDQELRAQVLYRLERFNESLALYRSLVRNCADDYGEEREANMAAACAARCLFGDAEQLNDADEDEAIKLLARDTYDQLYNVACALIGRGRLDEAAETLSEAERACREALAEDDQETLMEELAPIQFQQAYLAQKTGNQQRQQEARKTYQSIANAKLADASLLAVCANNLVCANRDQNLFDSKKRIKFASGDALKQKLTKKQKQAIAMNQCLVYLYSNQGDLCKRSAEQLLKSDPNNETLALIVAAQLARERTPGGASGGGVNASATNYLESLCAQQPDFVQTRIALAQLFAQAGSPRQACEALKQLPPDLLFSDRIVSAVMRLYASVEDRDAVTEFLADARRHYSETEPDDEKHKTLLKLSARFEQSGGNYPAAAALYSELLQLTPNDQRLIASLVHAYAQFDPPKAEETSRLLKETDSLLALTSGSRVDFDADQLESSFAFGSKYSAKRAPGPAKSGEKEAAKQAAASPASAAAAQ
ncbi:hypothetical protein BOX15_Mlig004229g2, partial [Macrostomum lignano]